MPQQTIEDETGARPQILVKEITEPLYVFLSEEITSCRQVRVQVYLESNIKNGSPDTHAGKSFLVYARA